MLELGSDLWKEGIEQIGRSHDDWETASSISGCMDIVLEALPHTSHTPIEQMTWYIDRELEDEYDLLQRREKVLKSGIYMSEHWREVASILEDRLVKGQPTIDHEFHALYQRENIGRWILTACRMSGQDEKIIPFLEREVDYCLNYDTLVKALMDAGEVERARKWSIHGFQQTAGEYPGIASTLKKRLR